MDLSEWNKKFGGDEGMDPFKAEKGNGFEFELDVAYPCRIKRAVRVTNPRNNNEEIRLMLSIQDSDGDEAGVLGETTEHVTIPWQETDKNIERSKRETILRMRMDTLKRIFSAAVPADYAPYWKSEDHPEKPGKKIYLDFDGSALVDGKYNERGTAVNERLLCKVEWLKNNEGADVDELTDALLYIHKKRNPNSEKYPWTNWYVTRPEKVPVFGESEAPF